MNTDQIRSWHAQGMSRAHDVPHLCDEIERLRAELAEVERTNALLMRNAAENWRVKAAIARVRELCASHAGDDKVSRASVLEAIEGEQA